MPTLTITRGLPGAGKTHWARAYVAEDPAARVRVNRDNLRSMLHNGAHIVPNAAGNATGTEPSVRAARNALIRTLLDRGLDVVCDDTNLPQRSARELRALAQMHGAEFAVHDLRDVPLETCLERNAARPGRQVPEHRIRQMHHKYIASGDRLGPLPDEPGHDRAPYTPPAEAPTAYIVDVDGTVALMGDRSPYDGSRVKEDKPNDPVVQLVQTLYLAGHEIVFCSGRKEYCRADTEAWLTEHVGVPGSVLHMRADGDNRKDSIVKLEIFDREIRHRYRVLGVLDDRRQVVEAWRSIGLTVFQVAPGDH